MFLRNHLDDFAPRADRDLGIKWKPACEFGAKLRPRDWPPDHGAASAAHLAAMPEFTPRSLRCIDHPPTVGQIDTIRDLVPVTRETPRPTRAHYSS